MRAGAVGFSDAKPQRHSETDVAFCDKSPGKITRPVGDPPGRLRNPASRTRLVGAPRESQATEGRTAGVPLARHRCPASSNELARGRRLTGGLKIGKDMSKVRVAIVGVGNVGATTAYALFCQGWLPTLCWLIETARKPKAKRRI